MWRQHPRPAITDELRLAAALAEHDLAELDSCRVGGETRPAVLGERLYRPLGDDGENGVRMLRSRRLRALRSRGMAARRIGAA